MVEENKISIFGYYPFLKQLLHDGQFRWTTPEQIGNEVLVTTLYLDGDMLCWYLTGEDDKPRDISEEDLESHIRKIDRDLNSINVLANHIGMAVAFLVAAVTFILNPEGLVENLMIVSGVSLAGYLSRKFTRPFIIKILGKIVGLFIGKVSGA